MFNVRMIGSMRGALLRVAVMALCLAGCSSSSQTTRPVEVASSGAPAARVQEHLNRQVIWQLY